MGDVRLGPPKGLIINLRDEFKLDYFVETGTYHGNTANWASSEFERVETVELSDELYNRVSEDYEDKENINFIKGKSQEQLPNIINELEEPAIFWLDAHYSGGVTAGEEYECPLLEELESIGNSNQSNYILIDDARLFLSPPPRPHSAEDWPTISDVVTTIIEELGESYYITITEDVIVAVPPIAREVVLTYAQDVVTEKSNATKFQEGITKVKNGIRLVIQGILEEVATEKNIKMLKKTGLYPVARHVYNKIR